ncbi:MAG: hypothetical protein SVY15_04085 [Halobacteriota archaeon]|nr:hypothetical protein [Halobacteriota archaeon]
MSREELIECIEKQNTFIASQNLTIERLRLEVDKSRAKVFKIQHESKLEKELNKPRCKCVCGCSRPVKKDYHKLCTFCYNHPDTNKHHLPEGMALTTNKKNYTIEHPSDLDATPKRERWGLWS